MKYVRTKDGRILVADDNSPMAKLTTNPVADTIEELCDEIVLVGVSGIPYGAHNLATEEEKQNKKFLIELIKSQEYEIYASIWVDGDLIKVAKMNEKGELKLL